MSLNSDIKFDLEGERQKESNQEEKVLFGLKVKKDTTRANIIAIPLLFFVCSTANFYSSTLLPLLLADKKYFGIKQSELGTATSTVIFWAQVVPLVTFPLYAFIFEFLGRRIPILFSMCFILVSNYYYPRVAPQMSHLITLRVFLALANTIIIGTPLISDYIKQESRGKAIAVQSVSIGLSNVFATLVLVPLTIDMDFDDAFAVSTIVLACAAFPVLFMVREPVIKQRKEQS